MPASQHAIATENGCRATDHAESERQSTPGPQVRRVGVIIVRIERAYSDLCPPNHQFSFMLGPLVPKSICQRFYDLRLRVLRPGRPPGSAVFPPETTCQAPFISGLSRSTADLSASRRCSMRVAYSFAAWQPIPQCADLGAGTAVLNAAHAIAEARAMTLWCNARVSALGFLRATRMENRRR